MLSTSQSQFSPTPANLFNNFDPRRVDGLKSLISTAKASGAVKKFLPSAVTGIWGSLFFGRIYYQTYQLLLLHTYQLMIDESRNKPINYG